MREADGATTGASQTETMVRPWGGSPGGRGVDALASGTGATLILLVGVLLSGCGGVRGPLGGDGGHPAVEEPG